ncbi:hypothetical protein GOBAR_AA06397 [Gossypium barbadense]|uniref:Uncharacterized protein n=1 Tax=Gossypium barbadense TaxID=3634 RepID=A0A2P5YF28_GOSBA|nr:hypothetical protein GOBAR_AA06397 [Gossypium barbadense]
MPSNNESNSMEQLNAIAIQDEEGLVAKPRPEPVVSEGELTLRVGDKTINLQARNLNNTSKIEDRGITMNQNYARTSSMPHQNQLKVGDKVSLDVADPHIDTAKLNEEIPLTVLSIFLFGTVEVSHPKFSTLKVNNTRLKPYFDEIHSRDEEYKLLEPP